MVSIKDVAELAGVSTATVSRVLSGKAGVSAALRAQVEEAIKALDYRPNLVARTLRAQQSVTVGLIVSDICNPFFTDVSRAVEDTLYAAGYTVFFCNADENPEKERLYLEAMHAQKVAGLIYSPTRQQTENFEALEILIPTVILDRAVPSAAVDMVLIDNEDAAYRLTRHLIENGYRRIGVLLGAASTTGRERYKGYERALQEYGLSPAQQLVFYQPPRVEDGRSATMQLLESPVRPEAIVTTNSLLGAGALLAIRERGLRVPEDIALASFDETLWARLVEPGVTIIAQPTYEIGKTAAELLLQRIQDPGRPARKVILQGQLVIRGSSAPRAAGPPGKG